MADPAGSPDSIEELWGLIADRLVPTGRRFAITLRHRRSPDSRGPGRAAAKIGVTPASIGEPRGTLYLGRLARHAQRIITESRRWQRSPETSEERPG